METAGSPQTTPQERQMATLAHVLQIFFGFLGPLIIFLVKRNSRFVAFHALQAIFWHLLLAATAILTVVLVLGFVFLGLASQAAGADQPSPVFFLAVPIIALFAMCAGPVTVVLAIVFAVKASQGQWSQYPLVGGWAKRVAGA